MIYSSTSVVYLLISTIALLTTAVSAVVGLWIAARWKPDGSPEARGELEKRAYLITTMTGVVLFAKLFSLPLWFWTLQTLVPMVPGAMCLTGVHMAVYPISFFATGAKLLVPMMYAYWLVLHSMDRVVPTQPFFRTKLLLIAPILLVLAVESVLDAKVLTSIRPTPVSCCTSVFDEPSTAAGKLLGGSAGWSWTGAFVALCAWALIAFEILRKRCHPILCVAAILSVPAILAVFVIALHANLGPILLNAPFHHCAFCLWQDTWSAPVYITAFVAGIWLLGVQAIVALAGRRKALVTIAERTLKRLRNLGGGLISASLLLILAHLIVALGRKE